MDINSDYFIPLCVPHIKGNESKYIQECLDTNWVSSAGAFVDRFQDLLASYVGSKYAIATINGTSALHVALKVAGVEPDDEVLVSTLTFIAPVNAIRYLGAWPVFMDSDPIYWQMDAEKVKTFLDSECKWDGRALRNKKTGRRIAAILPVHILGHPCDMDSIMESANRYGLNVVEDASESLGATHKGRKVGHIGDIGCFSFNGNKLITTGSGGMIVTDNPHWGERALYLTTQAKDDPHEYVHNEIGFNYRLSNIQAAMGVAQMEKIDEFIFTKRLIAHKYMEGFSDLNQIIPMPQHQDVEATYWLYTLLLGTDLGLSDRKRISEFLQQHKIVARPLWQPIHRQVPYVDCQRFLIENADSIYERSVNLPSSVGLSQGDQEYCINVIKNILG